jgi:hypothetical protein
LTATCNVLKGLNNPWRTMRWPKKFDIEGKSAR